MDMKEMINMSKEEMMNVNMEDITDVNFNDTAEVDMSVMSEVNVDDLMTDVAEVQTILQCSNIGQMIDVNEIYEKLEELTYIGREQRIEYVATQLLHKLGVIVEQDVAPEERVFRFSIQSSEVNLVESPPWPHERVAASEVYESGDRGTESSMLYSNDIAPAAAACENYITEPSHDFCPNFMSVPAPDVIFTNSLISNQSQTEHSNVEIQSDCCREYDPDAETLFHEAELIYSILPHHDFEQIYACLEANRECDVRVDIVTDMFMQIDAESGVAQLPSVEVTPTSSVDTSHGASVRTNLASVCASSITPLMTPSVDEIAACHNQTAAHDAKLHSVKHSDGASPSLPQKMSADAGLKGGNFSGSEHRDQEGCQGTDGNVECEQMQIFHNVDVDIENAHKNVTDKLKIEAEYSKGNNNEEGEELTPLSIEQTIHEESVEVIPLSPEHQVNKESTEVIPLSVEQNDDEENVEMSPFSIRQTVHEESVEVIPLSPEQEDNQESVEVIPLFAEQKISKDDDEVLSLSAEQKDNKESIEVTLSSTAKQRMSEENFELAPSSSCKNTMELAAAENGDEVFDRIISDEGEEGTLSYNSCKELDGSSANPKRRRCMYKTGGGSNYGIVYEIYENRPSYVPEIVPSQNLSETSTLSFDSQDSTDVDFSSVHFADLKLDELHQEISDVITDFETAFRNSDTFAAERFENESRCDGLATVTKQEKDCDSSSVVEVEDCSNTSFEQTSASFGSTPTDDLFHFQGSLDEEQGDKIVDKLLELFPDADIDFLTEVSCQFKSLTDMANRVLECTEIEQKKDDVSDTLIGSVSPVGALVSKPPAQGCRKKEITYEEFESSLPHVDPVFLMKKWEMIGNDYNAVKEFIAEQMQETSNNSQYHMLLSLFPHADPTFLREKCDAIGSNEAALKDFIEEQSRNKVDSQYHTLLAIFPQVDPGYLREKCVEIGSDEAAMREFVAEQLKKNEKDDHYQNLVAMFPHADPAFLRENVQRIGDDEDAMRIFVTQLLDEVDGVKFETLLSVLPDADPEYLRATFHRIGNDEEGIKVFLLESLENKDYPTREAFLKRQEMAALRRKYKEEFSIEDFIEMIPDPWKHFGEKDNSNSSELIRNHGMAYLETRYKTIARNDIKMLFQKNNYNLTLTCMDLDSWTGLLSLPCNTCTVPDTEDIPVSFFQEVAFIENKQRIKDFILRKEHRKKEAFEMAKARGELLECMCCFDSEVMAEDMATCTDGHLFCKECIRRAAEVAIGNAQSGFSCLTTCSAEFSLKVLRTVLKPVLFSRMVQMKQLEEVQAAGIQDLESCPFCDFATIPPPDSKVFLCYNQKCMRDSCRKCKRPNHIPLHCDEVESKEVKMRTYIENRMTDALVRSCWKCKKQFIKEAGCNKMTCTCGAIMCYICRQPVTNYSHFNGQGGTEYHKCPLYSDLQVIHDVAVQEEGIKAKKIVQAENPDIELKYDPTQPVGLPH